MKDLLIRAGAFVFLTTLSTGLLALPYLTITSAPVEIAASEGTFAAQ